MIVCLCAEPDVASSSRLKKPANLILINQEHFKALLCEEEQLEMYDADAFKAISGSLVPKLLRDLAQFPPLLIGCHLLPRQH